MNQKCVFLHEIAKEVVRTAGTELDKSAQSKIREHIFNAVRLEIHGRLARLIFNGTAFEEIPNQIRPKVLHDPSTWTPRQLTIALLTDKSKLDQEYQSIEKNLSKMKL